MNVLALDLSISATGVALPGGQLLTWKPTVTGDSRLVELADRVVSVLSGQAVEVVVLEDFVVRTPAAGAIGMVHGAIRCVLIRHGIPYATVPPASLKKYATGKGNATKPDMRVALLRRTGADERDDNMVDAAWLWRMARDRYTGQAVVPKDQRVALAKVQWPNLREVAA